MPSTQYKINYALIGVGPELGLVIQRLLFFFLTRVFTVILRA